MRYSDPFIGQRNYGRGQASNTIDLAQAGTAQFAPNLANIAANTPFVRRNVIAFLVEAPKFFQYADDPEAAVAALKAFIEVHSRTIEGLNRGLTVDSADSPYGGSGEVIQSPINVTRARSTPNHGAFELQGRAITKFTHWWITYGIADENTKVPLVVSDGAVEATDYDATFYGATVLYIEPDPTFREVVSAWLCTNMYPTATPPWEGSKDASQIGQDLQVNVEFTATTDVSVGTMRFARKVLQNLNLAGMNPNENPLWIENISADVLAVDNGIKRQLETGARERITY